MKILVIGATGVIGRRAIPLLVKRGHAVTGTTRASDKRPAIAGMGAQPLVVDLFDLDRVRSAVKGHDTVINLATSIPPSSKAILSWAWRENTRVRRYVSANITAAAKGAHVKRLIQESFAPIYASGGDDWLMETARVKPARYNRAVLDAERAACLFSTGGATEVVLRFAYFYGPDSNFTLDLIRMVRKGWAPVLGSPNAFISSVSHDDAAAAVVTALTAPPGIYNVTDDEPLTKQEFFSSLANALGVPAPRFPPSWLPRLLGSVGETLSRSQRISNLKLRSVGWAPVFRSVSAAWPSVIATVRAGLERSGAADVDRNGAPASLIESHHAERAPRRVSNKNRDPDVDRPQRSSLLDHEADTERHQNL
jgi:2-alkyl-3-oxoalkanoate reductase